LIRVHVLQSQEGGAFRKGSTIWFPTPTFQTFTISISYKDTWFLATLDPLRFCVRLDEPINKRLKIGFVIYKVSRIASAQQRSACFNTIWVFGELRPDLH
jgi:hypothetical protein